MKAFTPSGPSPAFASLVYPTYTVSTVNTATAVTLTTDQVLGGFILQDPNGGACPPTLPKAAALVAAVQGAAVNRGFEFTIRNTADGNETITVAAGTGGTMSGTATIAQNNSKRFLLVLTNVTSGSEAYTCY